MDKNETPTHRFLELRQERDQHRVAYLRVDKEVPSKDVLTYFEDWVLYDQVEEYIDKDWDDYGCDHGKCYIIEDDKSLYVDDNGVSYLDSIVCDVSLNKDGTLRYE